MAESSSSDSHDSWPEDMWMSTIHRIPKHEFQSFSEMVNNCEFSDFTFTVNDNTYFAHRVILATRSPVFAAMLRSNMVEAQHNNVVIDDIDCNIFEQFLRYIYTGNNTTELKRFARQLLPIADKYEIISLKELCEYNIDLKCIDVIETLTIAQQYHCSILKKRCIDFILDNLRAIRATHEWQQLLKDEPKMVDNIFENIERSRNRFNDYEDDWG